VLRPAREWQHRQQAAAAAKRRAARGSQGALHGRRRAGAPRGPLRPWPPTAQPRAEAAASAAASVAVLEHAAHGAGVLATSRQLLRQQRSSQRLRLGAPLPFAVGAGVKHKRQNQGSLSKRVKSLRLQLLLRLFRCLAAGWLSGRASQEAALVAARLEAQQLVLAQSRSRRRGERGGRGKAGRRLGGRPLALLQGRLRLPLLLCRHHRRCHSRPPLTLLQALCCAPREQPLPLLLLPCRARRVCPRRRHRLLHWRFQVLLLLARPRRGASAAALPPASCPCRRKPKQLHTARQARGYTLGFARQTAPGALAPAAAAAASAAAAHQPVIRLPRGEGCSTSQTSGPRADPAGRSGRQRDCAQHCFPLT